MATLEKRGDSWRAIVRRKGFPIQRATFDTKAEAHRWATLVERKLTEQRRLGQHQDMADAMKLSVSDALDRYKEEVTPTKKNEGSRRNEGHYIRRIQQDPIGDMKLIAVRSRDVAAFIERLQGSGLGANSVRLHLAVLSHCYNLARTHWSMDLLSNPVQGVRKPKLPKGRDRRLVGDEESNLIESAVIENPELADIVIFALETTARKEEIYNMQWRLVDLKKHTAILIDTKNGDTRVAPLSVRAEAALTRQQARVKLSLPKGKRMPARVWTYEKMTRMYDAYRRARKDAGITGLTFHDLRHEATSRLFERGLNPMVIQTITGHKTVQMLKRYTHLQTDTLVAAVRGST